MKNALHAGAMTALLLAAFSATAAEVSKSEILAELDKVVANYNNIEMQSFRVQVRCPEMEKLVLAKLAAGTPIPWQPGFVLVSGSGDRSFEANVESVPEPFREKAQAKIKQLCPEYFQMMEKGTPHFVAQFMKAVGSSAQFDVISSDKATLEFEMNELNEPFLGKKVHSFRLKIDRRDKTFEGCTFDFGNNEHIKIKFYHTLHELPDHTKLNLMSQVDCEQTAFATGENPPPPKSSMFFENYQFAPVAAAPAESKATPPPKTETVVSMENLKTPPATPEPHVSPTVSGDVDLAALAKNKAEWPAEVTLTTKVSVPVIIRGKQYGSTDLPVGTTLTLVDVNGAQIKVTKGQTIYSVAAVFTDLVPRVVALRKAKAAGTGDN